jgi:DNA polymerase (family 10)
LSADDLARQAIEVDAVGREVPDLALFKGVEAEIRTDGTLDYDEEVLEGLDYVVASVHSRLDQDETEMTARILRAIGHPKVAILAHPTGRLLLGREPVRLDVEAVLQACLRHHVAVEVNANPQRLDLDWRNLRRAAELGVPVAINSDAHDAAGLSDVGWGVATARKAAVPRGLVMNSWPVGRIAAFFRKEAAS